MTVNHIMLCIYAFVGAFGVFGAYAGDEPGSDALALVGVVALIGAWVSVRAIRSETYLINKYGSIDNAKRRAAQLESEIAVGGTRPMPRCQGCGARVSGGKCTFCGRAG